jgi:hypothetical protein
MYFGPFVGLPHLDPFTHPGSEESDEQKRDKPMLWCSEQSLHALLDEGLRR